MNAFSSIHNGISTGKKIINSFLPVEISAWWDGADPNGNGIYPANGATITTWMDKSGKGFHASGGSATYSTPDKCLIFNNTGYTTNYPTNPTTETMFIVFNVTTVANIYIIGSNVNGSRTTGLTESVSPNAKYVILKSGVVLGAIQSGVINATTILATTTVNTSSSQTTASLNGGTPSTANTISSFDAGSTYIGKDATQNGFTGKFMEIMIYNRVLTNDEQKKVEGYLGWKWNLQGSLPASHPYKNYNPFTITGATSSSIRQNQIIQITGGTGTITFNGISKISILVVGGGGAGGREAGGGGGGGGGVIALSNISVTSDTAYTITVGAGGTVTLNRGFNGGNSEFGTYTAIGGGGGGGAGSGGGGGGCGGGGDGYHAVGGTATQSTSSSGGFGNNGGNGANNGSIQAGGGGGGAGDVGLPAKTTSTPYGGNGGPGYSSNITGTATFYAGGGGGGTSIPNNADGIRSNSGQGGGGRGGAGTSNASPGTTNTGGGGGGGGYPDHGQGQGRPAAGGSGIIIIRYFF